MRLHERGYHGRRNATAQSLLSAQAGTTALTSAAIAALQPKKEAAKSPRDNRGREAPSRLRAAPKGARSGMPVGAPLGAGPSVLGRSLTTSHKSICRDTWTNFRSGGTAARLRMASALAPRSRAQRASALCTYQYQPKILRKSRATCAFA